MVKRTTYSINLGGQLISLAQPLVMGILNVTPDSFYSDSRCYADEAIVARVKQIINEGGDIIDIGGYSSRPGAEVVSEDEEYARLERGIRAVRAVDAEIPISIDTFRASVARRCVENFGAMIINDISGGTLDDKMFETVAQLRVPYILMHMRGTPETMSSLTDYEDVVSDVVRDLADKVNRLAILGVNDIIIDPGFGFSKNVEQNYAMMARLSEFHILNLPLLVGVSRKSMIYKPLNITPQEALNGTTVLNTLALMAGVHILRVHDVKECVEVVKMITMMRNNKNS